MRIKLSLIVIGLLACPAQGQTPVPIRIVHTGKDSVGQVLAYQIREEIASSKTIRPASETDYPRFQIAMVTIDPNEKQTQTAYSASLLMLFSNKDNDMPFFVTSTVGVCGSSRTKECATMIVAAIQPYLPN